MIFEQLLGPVPKPVFMEEHYLKQPFDRPGGCRDLVALGGWAVAEHILAQPGADVLAGREGRPYEGRLPPAPGEARSLLAAGYTLGIRHAEKHDPGLAGLAED